MLARRKIHVVWRPLTRRFSRLIITCMVGISALVLPIESAHASPDSRKLTTVSDNGPSIDASTSNAQAFRNRHTGGCLAGYEPGSRPYTELPGKHDPCGNNSTETWFVHKWRDGTVELKIYRSFIGYSCLDDSEHGLRMWDCNALPYQSWYIRTFGSYIELRNQHTGLCLDDSEHGLRTYPCSHVPQNYQLWF